MAVPSRIQYINCDIYVCFNGSHFEDDADCEDDADDTSSECLDYDHADNF